MDLERQKEIIEREPPKPIVGIKYEWLPEDRLCAPCARVVCAGQLVVRRTAIGRSFEDVLPLKYGYCMSCAADGLSQRAVEEYENTLAQVQHYETLRDKEELTEQQQKDMNTLERSIEGLQDYVEDLSDFVAYTEQSGVAYYDDELEDDDE